LHLHGWTSRPTYPPMYSMPNALGIVMGVGNAGRHLSMDEDEASTWFSRDGGLTWREVEKKVHIYEYGDHGGLIVLADSVKPTKEIVYSWTEGLAWWHFEFTDEEVRVENVISEVTNSRLQFLVYGVFAQTGKGALFHLDFRDITRECQGFSNPGQSNSDYHIWKPGGKTTDCILGKMVQFTRRKQDAECHNGVHYQRKVESEPCKCTPEDFVCAYGFERYQLYEEDETNLGTKDQDCVPNKEHPPDGCGEAIPAYRKITNDICFGELQHALYQLPPCRRPDTIAVVMSGLAIFAMILSVVGLCVGTKCLGFFSEGRRKYVELDVRTPSMALG